MSGLETKDIVAMYRYLVIKTAGLTDKELRYLGWLNKELQATFFVG